MPSSIVIDTSAVIHYLTDRTILGQAARDFLRKNTHMLIAPPLFLAETESTLNLLRLNKQLNQKELRLARTLWEAMQIEIIHLPETHATAREIADNLRLPRVYDATFAALAMLRGVDYYTADLAFYNAAKRKYPFVRIIGN